jgi:tetratricopeptide (TPR) repeat protein
MRYSVSGTFVGRAVAALFVAWSSVAVAQSAGAQAEVLFRQARDLLAAGKVAEACSAFEESQNLESTVNTLLNLAACREKLGQFASAWGHFLEAVRQTRTATDARTQQLRDVAQARAQKLEPRVSKLTINVPQHSQVDGLEITRGTERVNPGLWNRALPIDGGTYTITARAPGSSPWSTEITVAPESDTRTVEIPDLRNLPRDVEGPAPRRVEARTEQSAAPPLAPGRVVPLVIGAGGLVLLGSGLGFELWARSQYDSAKAERTNQARRDSLYDAANTRRYVAQALAVSGVVAGGVAVWLYLRGRSEHAAATDASVKLVPSARGIAILGQF